MTVEKQIVRVLKAVELGCRTSLEVADLTGLSTSKASAYLSELCTDGLIRIIGKVRFPHSHKVFNEYVVF